MQALGTVLIDLTGRSATGAKAHVKEVVPTRSAIRVQGDEVDLSRHHVQFDAGSGAALYIIYTEQFRVGIHAGCTSVHHGVIAGALRVEAESRRLVDPNDKDLFRAITTTAPSQLSDTIRCAALINSQMVDNLNILLHTGGGHGDELTLTDLIAEEAIRAVLIYRTRGHLSTEALDTAQAFRTVGVVHTLKVEADPL